MEINFNYGKDKLKLNISKRNLMGTLIPKYVKPVSNSTGEVIKALNNPIGSEKLSSLLNENDEVVIIASDISRPAPTDVLLPPLLDEINEAGVLDDQIKIIFGLGIHRKQTKKEKENLVGKEVYQRVECIDHNVNRCKYIGETESKVPVKIFDEVLKADFLIATGNIEFHYFAGFTGGAKAVAPGVCGKETIQANHKKFLDLKACGGNIKGNPVREEIEEIGEMVGIDFILNAVLNSEKEIVKVVAGDAKKAHRQAVTYIRKMYQQNIDKLADIVITSPGGYPKDIDLYQSHKAIENAALALKDDGIIIALAKCSDGLGENTFAEAVTEGSTVKELVEELNNNFILGRHKASRLASIHSNKKIYLVSELEKRIKEKLFLESYDYPQNAYEKALKEKGTEADVLVMPYGSSTLPNIARN